MANKQTAFNLPAGHQHSKHLSKNGIIPGEVEKLQKNTSEHEKKARAA